MKIKLSVFFIAVGLCIVFSASREAQAVLGESADSITSDRKAFSAVQHSQVERSNYTVHEIVTDSTAVREYVSPSGIVFGIAWNGLVHPDLSSLLGAYAGEYREALRQTTRQRGRRHLRVKTDGVIVEKWGHMRNLRGRAYAPALIPQGVRVDEIR